MYRLDWFLSQKPGGTGVFRASVTQATRSRSTGASEPVTSPNMSSEASSGSRRSSLAIGTVRQRERPEDMHHLRPDVLTHHLREVLVHRERRCPPPTATSDASAAMAAGRDAVVSDRLLEAKEVAELLAVPESWVRESTRSGAIPVVELGRYRRYREADVLAWLESCSRPGRAIVMRRSAT